MVNKSKTAVEPLVATVILILVTVTIGVIVFAVVLPLIQNRLIESGGAACLSARVVVNTEEGYTCYDSATQTVNVMVERGPDEFELSSIQILVYYDGTTKTFIVNQSLPNENEKKMFSVNINEPGKTAKSVAVAPMMKIGKTQKFCSITSTAKLPKCT